MRKLFRELQEHATPHLLYVIRSISDQGSRAERLQNQLNAIFLIISHMNKVNEIVNNALNKDDLPF